MLCFSPSKPDHSSLKPGFREKLFSGVINMQDTTTGNYSIYGFGNFGLPFAINSKDEEELLSLPEEIQQVLLHQGGDSEIKLHKELEELKMKE